MSPEPALLLNRRVAAAFLPQTVGYAALLAVYPHSEPSAVVATIQSVPTFLLVLFALPAIPALALTLVVGAVLSVSVSHRRRSPRSCSRAATSSSSPAPTPSPSAPPGRTGGRGT